MFDMCQRVTIYPANSEKAKLFPLNGILPVLSVEINASVKNLADTARVAIPFTVMNERIGWVGEIMPGDKITIDLGYDDNLVREFTGYVDKINYPNGTAAEIECIDELRIFKKRIKDIELKPTSVKKIAEYVTGQINSSFNVVCNEYDIPYEKFTIYQATGFDVLRKLQEETLADIYFDSDSNSLYIVPPYINYNGQASPVKFNPFINVESVDLAYVRAFDTPLMVTIESTQLNGKVISAQEGTTGGSEIKIKTAGQSLSDIKALAKLTYTARNRDRYEGEFTAWLIPYVKPGYTVEYFDYDFPELKGNYYVDSVNVSFGAEGGKRKITLGIKLN